MITPLKTVAAILIGAFAISGVAFADHPSVNPNLGTPIHDNSATRTITIDSSTRWVNVWEEQKVKFIVKTANGKREFSWKFDTTNSPINLSGLAPEGILDKRSIKAYVEPDPEGYGFLR